MVAHTGLENRENQQPRLDLRRDGKSIRLLVRRSLRLRNSLFWISAYFECFRSDLKFVALGEANCLTFLAPQMATSRFRTARSAPGSVVDQARKSSGNHWMNACVGERATQASYLRFRQSRVTRISTLHGVVFKKNGITNAAARFVG